MRSNHHRNKWYPRAVKGGIKYNPDFARYEAEKYAWIAHHPNATGEEYVEAMRALAQRCGI